MSDSVCFETGPIAIRYAVFNSNTVHGNACQKAMGIAIVVFVVGAASLLVNEYRPNKSPAKM